MKVIFHEEFQIEYTSDPAAEEGRMAAVVEIIEEEYEFVTAIHAGEEDIERVHSEAQMEYVKDEGVYDISLLAAGGAIQAAKIGLTEPAFALIRPPGHHASRDSSWGFCYFNNMSVAIMHLKSNNLINSAYVLDIDMHYGDGNENILGGLDYVDVYNLETSDRVEYLNLISREMENCTADIIGISAGFDNHINDWGGVLYSEDYFEIGKMVKNCANINGSGCFAILEGGYNHNVLGGNVLALLKGME